MDRSVIQGGWTCKCNVTIYGRKCATCGDTAPSVMPHQLADARSSKSDDCRHWSPLDALLTMVGDIQEGKISPDQLLIIYRRPDNPGDERTTYHMNFFASGMTRQEHLALLELHWFRYMKEWTSPGED